MNYMQILPRVRKAVLEIAATDGPHRHAFMLGGLCNRIFGSDQTMRCHGRKHQSPSRKYRGQVQACLVVLAREGVMYSRRRASETRPHENIDKIFNIRISRADAKVRLEKMK